MLAAVGSAPAQQQFTPRIGYVYPAGGAAGSAFEVTVGGQHLDGINSVMISGAGIQATVLEVHKALTKQQAKDLAERLKQLQKKDKKDPQTLKEIASIIARLAVFNKNANPAIAETVTLRVVISPDAEPSERELRLCSAAAVSNPRIFCVGELPEYSHKSAVEEKKVVSLKDLKKKRGNEPQASAPLPDADITLPVVINGQIMPGRVDRYRFGAKRGQKIVIACSARALIPYLPDAVPGWFQAAVGLYDSKHTELAYDDDFRFHPDPVLYYEIQRDGEYTLEVRDSLYRGREDFVYRITVGELPFITNIYPLGGKTGVDTSIALKGWNLPHERFIQNKNARPGLYQLFTQKEKFRSNHVPFSVSNLPECQEIAQHDTMETAQPLTLPVIVNGRIDKPGDTDAYRFEGRAGAPFVAEVIARRLDSPLDSFLKLTDAAGKQVAFNDDHEDKGSGLNTHHADSYIRTNFPASGTYYLVIGDAQQKGGPEFAYRLRISAPIPDFELRVAPSSINVRGGTPVAITVYALRRDGFNGPIDVTLKNPPTGFTISGGRIPAGQDQVRLTLTAPPSPTQAPNNLHFQGRAKINDQEIVRAAVPTEDMMQAFAYRHLVPSQDLKIAISGKFMPRTTARILSETPLKIAPGGAAKLRFSVPATTFFGKLEYELNEPPDGVTIASSGPTREGTEIVLKSDADATKPGQKGNLIINIFSAVGGDKNKKKVRLPIVTLPAVPYEVVTR
jgi:hypothetical protein